MILVTGASGFIGRALCRDLVARGLATAGTYRGDRRDAVPAGVEVRQIGDLGGGDPWRGALSGISAVVHVAGLAHVTGARSDLDRRAVSVNAEATRSLALASAEAGVRRLVFISTSKVHGEASESPIRECDAPVPDDPYAASKLAAEAALAEAARSGRIETVVLRPPLVYGPGVKANFRALLALCDSPWPLPFGGIIGNRRALLYVGNLIGAIREALDHPKAAGKTYLVADDGARSTAEIVGAIRAAFGRRPRLLSVPPEVLRSSAGLVHRTSAVARLLESFEIDASLIKRDLGWRPPFSFEQGLAATAAWFRTSRS
jgi:nucleoside-diphosphate-sugar epimerase